jgi:transcriptional regulator with XRE-family HTH domain
LKYRVASSRWSVNTLIEKLINVPTPFASFVNRYLYDRNLTQTWLAEQVGITKESLSRIMRGRHRPNADLALAISKAFGLSEEEKQELLATIPPRRRGSKQDTSAPSATALLAPIRVQRPQPSPQRQVLDAQLRQLRQDLSAIKRKALDLAVEIAALEERIDEMEGKE